MLLCDAVPKEQYTMDTIPPYELGEHQLIQYAHSDCHRTTLMLHIRQVWPYLAFEYGSNIVCFSTSYHGIQFGICAWQISWCDVEIMLCRTKNECGHCIASFVGAVCSIIHLINVFIRFQFWSSGIVIACLSLCVCVCLSVCVTISYLCTQ